MRGEIKNEKLQDHVKILNKYTRQQNHLNFYKVSLYGLNIL